MTISSVGSSSSVYDQWLLAIQQQQRRAAAGIQPCSGQGSGGGAPSGPQGFAALVQQPAAPALTDVQAASIGASIQRNAPDLFKSLDADGNGSLSAAELQARLHPSASPGFSADQATVISHDIQRNSPGLFKALDTDADGSISATELKNGLERLQQASGTEGHHHHHLRAEGALPPAAAADQASSEAGQSGQQKLQSNLMQDVMRTLSASLHGG
jgi:hypothetical protein